MGVNAHARSGDMAVVVSSNVPLLRENPEEIGYIPRVSFDDDHVIRRLDAGEHAIILTKVKAGSAKQGHVFLVLVGTHVGWLWNHDVMVWDS